MGIDLELGPDTLYFFPDDDSVVIGAAGEDNTETRVSPGNLPYGTFMTLELFEKLGFGGIGDIEELDGTVRGTGGKLLAEIIELHVVYQIFVFSFKIHT
jgi:hypothetical protein